MARSYLGRISLEHDGKDTREDSALFARGLPGTRAIVDELEEEPEQHLALAHHGARRVEIQAIERQSRRSTPRDTHTPRVNLAIAIGAAILRSHVPVDGFDVGTRVRMLAHERNHEHGFGKLDVTQAT